MVVAFLDRSSRNLEDRVRIQAELTRRNIGIVAIGEDIDTREGSAAAKFFRRPTLAQGGVLPGGFGQRAGLVGAGPGSRQRESGWVAPRRMDCEGAELRHIARVMG